MTGLEPGFEWTFNGQKVINSENIKIEVVDSFSTLTMRNLHSHNSGLYTCAASNSFGSDQTSTEIIVKGEFIYLFR